MTSPVRKKPVVAVGSVAFVGAGPGDPDLLTLRASNLLATADVVVHDSDVPAELLLGARPDARYAIRIKAGF